MWLVGIDPELVSAWTEVFAGFPNVHVAEDDILAIAENTIVSPHSYTFKADF
ncbi:MAG: hypothetical protein H8E17_17350 [Deltaproteobacteria bacterium]|nr:hypothetical protein [Deltaproteobacteria bacterium]